MKNQPMTLAFISILNESETVNTLDRAIGSISLLSQLVDSMKPDADTLNLEDLAAMLDLIRDEIAGARELMTSIVFERFPVPHSDLASGVDLQNDSHALRSMADYLISRALGLESVPAKVKAAA